MSNPNEEFREQIVIEQDTQDNNLDINLPLQQVVVENDTWNESVEEEEISPALDESNRSWSWVTKLLLISFTLLVGVELYDFFSTGFVESPFVTSLYAVLTLCIGTLAGSALLRELSGLRQYNRSQSLQQLIDQYVDSDNTKLLVPALDKITQKLPSDLDSQQLAAWQDSLEKGLSSSELVDTYSRVVLKPVDEKAIKEISKFSTEAVAMVAISPMAILDMLLLLWRNLRMIDKVASLYGLQLGYWSRVRLLKQVFVNMAYAGASELLVDIGTDAVGAELVGKLSGKFAQGFGAGMLTARLGLKVMHLSRPVPFKEQKPTLSLVRKQIVNQVLSIISKGKLSSELVGKKTGSKLR